ncbi:MAG: T9SS type A sorting domain-containing protein [bacterium]|nr:T9SS type A sorting domain-containing protein [bacterium]
MRRLTLLIAILFCFADNADAGWIKRADMAGAGRHRGTGCAIGNKGYMGLGHYNGTGVNIVLKDWWEYDPSTNAWTQKADYIGGTSAGNYGVLTLGIGDYAYITGGAFNDPDVHRYDPKTNTWTTVATAPESFSNTEGFVIEDKGYAMRSGNLYEFDTSNNTWNYLGNLPFGLSTWMGAFSLGEKGYVRTSGGFYEYKATTNQWVLRAGFPGIATAASMNFTQRGKLYVIAGYGGGLSNVTDEVWEYDPFLNTWTMLEEFPGTSRRFGAAFSIGDRSYCGTGTNGTNFADFWEFDSELYLSTDYLSLEKVNLYPNPAIDHVTIDLEGYDQFSVDLLDATGQTVQRLTSNNGSIRIERENLPVGQYFAHIQVKEHYLGTKKLIFQ